MLSEDNGQCLQRNFEQIHMPTQSWHTLPMVTSHERSLDKTEKKVLVSKPHSQTQCSRPRPSTRTKQPSLRMAKYQAHSQDAFKIERSTKDLQGLRAFLKTTHLSLDQSLTQKRCRIVNSPSDVISGTPYGNFLPQAIQPSQPLVSDALRNSEHWNPLLAFNYYPA